MFCGIDLGTTTTKITICNSASVPLWSDQISHNAHVENVATECREQNSLCFRDSLRQLMPRIPPLILKHVEHITFTGQMHGVIQWDLKNNECSNLITWEDRRASHAFISGLHLSPLFPPVHPGYGLVTLLFNKVHIPHQKSFKIWGSIMDYFTWYTLHSIMGATSDYRVKTSAQVANSFGFFSPRSKVFDIESLGKLGFDVSTLPEVVDESFVIGTTTGDFFGIPPGCKVYAPLGDTQCAFYSVIKLQPQSYILNLGTSCQLGKIHDHSCGPLLIEQSAGQVFPYFEDKMLALVASMNGGNVLQEFGENWFLPFVSGTNQKRGAETGKSFKDEMKQVYEIMVNSGIKAIEENYSVENKLTMRMPFFCERNSDGANEMAASLVNITPANCNLGQLSLALHRSVIENIKDLSSTFFGESLSDKKVIAVGTIFQKNKLFELIVEEEYPNCTISEADSSLGAAQYISQIAHCSD